MQLRKCALNSKAEPLALLSLMFIVALPVYKLALSRMYT